MTTATNSVHEEMLAEHETTVDELKDLWISKGKRAIATQLQEAFDLLVAGEKLDATTTDQRVLTLLDLNRITRKVKSEEAWELNDYTQAEDYL